MAILELKHVTFEVPEQRIIDDLSLEVAASDFISVVGPSGSGKSTLLKLIADLLPPSEGELFFKGKNYLDYPPTELRQHVMMCFQNPYLFGDKVIENLEFPYKVRKETVDPDRIRELLEEFEMSESFLDKEVSTLSGGEKQRIALIRSLIFEPDVLLLDEITSSLDVANTKIVERVIERRHADGAAVLWITHDPEQSKRYANRIIVIDGGKLAKEEVL